MTHDEKKTLLEKIVSANIQSITISGLGEISAMTPIDAYVLGVELTIEKIVQIVRGMAVERIT